MKKVNIDNDKLLLELNSLKNEYASLKMMYEKDTFEHRKVERGLRASEERFRSLYIDSREAIMVLSQEEGFLSGNPAAIKLFACRDEQDFTSRAPSTLSPEFQPDGCRSADKANEMMKTAFEFGSNFFDWTHRRADGTEFPATVFLSRLEMDGAKMLQATVTDISEQKLVKEKLLESEEQFRTSFDQIAVGMVHVSSNGKFLRVNKQICDMLGYSHEELLAKSFQSITHPDNLSNNVDKLHQIIANEIESFSTEKKYIRKDGSVLWANLTVTAHRSAPGDFKYMISIIEDISERKRIENALKKSEEKYSKAFRMSPEAITINSMEDGTYIEVNDVFLSKTGLSKEMVLGRTSDDLNLWVSDKDREQFINELITNGYLKNFEIQFNVKGEIRDFLVSCEIIEIEEKRYGLNLIVDITDRKRVEMELLESETRIKSISNNISSGMIYQIIVKPDGKRKLTYLSDSVQQLYGSSPEECISDENLIYGRMLEDDRESLRITENESIKTLSAFKKEARIKNPSGEIRWSSFSSTPRVLKDGSTCWDGIEFDITSLKETERIVRESEAKLIEAMKIAKLAGWESNDEHQLVFNDQFYSLLNTTAEREGGYIMPLAHFFQKFIHPADLSIVETEIRKLQESNNPDSYLQATHRVICGDGEIKYITVHIRIEKDAVGHIFKTYGLYQDITGLIHTEEALRESEDRFRSIYESSIDAILVSSPDGRILSANKAACDMFGRTEEEICKAGRNGIINMNDPLLPEQLKTWEHIGKFKGEVNFVGKEGKLFPGELSTSEFLDKEGNKRTSLFIRDISERKRIENDLERRNAFIQTVLDNLPMGVALSEITNGKTFYFNKKFEEVYGWPKEELEDVSGFFQKVYPDENYRTKIMSRVISDIQSGDITRMHWENCLVTHKDGSKHIINAVNIPMHNQDIMVSTAVDITELQKALERAEESNRLKSSLLANMSHELRTPMTGIMGLAEILKSEIKNSAQQEMLQLIETSAKRLMNSLNSVLDFAQLQSSVNNFSLNKLSINDVIDSTIDRFKKSAAAKKIKLDAFTGEKQVLINANERMLTVLLSSLLDNAIKYTEKGSVTVSLETENENNMDFALIRIKDTGIGISPKDQALIFEEFRQASEGLNRSYEGLGLGLTIAKKILSDINGKIEVESIVDKGSEFRVRIPLIETRTLTNEKQGTEAALETQLPVVNKEFSAAKKKILYVEDNVLNAMVVKLYLAENYEVEHAINAASGLQKVKEMNYDLVLMDINLGRGMSGIELSKLIREMSDYKDIPIIAITGYAMYEDKEKIIEEGLTDYLPKPFDNEALNEIVLKNILKVA